MTVLFVYLDSIDYNVKAFSIIIPVKPAKCLRSRIGFPTAVVERFIHFTK